MHWLLILVALTAHAEKAAEDAAKAQAAVLDAELKARIAVLEGVYTEIAAFSKTPVETVLKNAEAATFDKKVLESEKLYNDLRARAEALVVQATNPSSWLSVNRQLTLAKLDLRRTTVMNDWRYFRDGRPDIVGRSVSNDRMRAVLEALLIDHEFCYSVKHCGKIAKGSNAAVRPNLEFMFQNVEVYKSKTDSVSGSAAADEEDAAPSPASVAPTKPEPLSTQP
ncbi:MAG: hypothetical protein HYZ71_07190 [Deltaproteobacteria bacterium]|nr:hypothetical protein [Deltaproteobacteria bacterium]